MVRELLRGGTGPLARYSTLTCCSLPALLAFVVRNIGNIPAQPSASGSLKPARRVGPRNAVFARVRSPALFTLYESLKPLTHVVDVDELARADCDDAPRARARFEVFARGGSPRRCPLHPRMYMRAGRGTRLAA
jgi:hypothetical protein